MKFNHITLRVLSLLFCGCKKSFNPSSHLSDKEYLQFLYQIAPFVNKKPDEISFEARFSKKVEPYYADVVRGTNAAIEYYYETDTATYFFYKHKDITSLFEHYRGLGGYCKMDKDGNITFLNLLYHTPRLTEAEMKARGLELFTEMVEKGNVQTFVGNRNYIHTPNADFYYNTKTNRWDYTENSSWKFLEEAKQAEILQRLINFSLPIFL